MNKQNLSELTTQLKTQNSPACLRQVDSKLKTNTPLAPYTTVGIGGPADILLTTTSKDELVNAITKARELNVPITILGGGSNVLISDGGIRGLVIRIQDNNIKIGETKLEKSTENETQTFVARWEADHKKGTFKYDFADLDYDE